MYKANATDQRTTRHAEWNRLKRTMQKRQRRPARASIPPPCTLVIFGAGGDLTKRLLMPSLYNLSADGLLDDSMQIIGVNHGQEETSAWRDDLT